MCQAVLDLARGINSGSYHGLVRRISGCYILVSLLEGSGSRLNGPEDVTVWLGGMATDV